MTKTIEDFISSDLGPPQPQKPPAPPSLTFSKGQWLSFPYLKVTSLDGRKQYLGDGGTSSMSGNRFELSSLDDNNSDAVTSFVFNIAISALEFDYNVSEQGMFGPNPDFVKATFRADSGEVIGTLDIPAGPEGQREHFATATFDGNGKKIKSVDIRKKGPGGWAGVNHFVMTI